MLEVDMGTVPALTVPEVTNDGCEVAIVRGTIPLAEAAPTTLSAGSTAGALADVVDIAGPVPAPVGVALLTPTTPAEVAAVGLGAETDTVDPLRPPDTARPLRIGDDADSDGSSMSADLDVAGRPS